MLSLAPEGTRAVLIGTSRFPRDPDNLPDLPGVVGDIEDLERLLCDPGVVGIPPRNVVRLLDQPTPTTVAEVLATSAQEADDLLLVYYAGHGLVGSSSLELFLATGDSTYLHAEYNSLPFAAVRRAVRDSPARKKIIVLDCCFSGRALDIMGADPGLVTANLDLQGTFALASAPANMPSIAPKGARHTAFTGQLLRVLDDGIDNGKEVLTLEDIYDHMRREMNRADLPEPQRVNFQEAGMFAFARNRRRATRTGEELERTVGELRARIEEQDVQLATMRRVAASSPAPPAVAPAEPATPLRRGMRMVSAAIAVLVPASLQTAVANQTGDTSTQAAVAGVVILLVLIGLGWLARRADANPTGVAALVFPSWPAPDLVVRFVFWAAFPVLFLTLWAFRQGWPT